MLRISLLSGGVILLFASCLLALLSGLGQGINDGEWRNISRTGLPLAPDRLQWSPWQPNDGSVYPFHSVGGENKPDTLPEFRVGRRGGVFFDFVFYEGRYTRDGIIREFPAIGPGWGARYHWIWSGVALALGVCLLGVARGLRVR